MPKKVRKVPSRRKLNTAPPQLPPGVKLVRTLQGHTDYIARIAWSPDGRILASPSADKTVRLWDIEMGECLRTLNGHSGSVFSVAFDATATPLPVVVRTARSSCGMPTRASACTH